MRLGAIGLVMMVGTIAVLDAYYPGGLFTLFATGTAPNVADEAYARTMAFTTLMMFQLFNVYNCRSHWRSAFSGFFDNKWLLVAVALSLCTHVLVIYVPFLQTAFHTVPLTLADWLIASGGRVHAAHCIGAGQDRAAHRAAAGAGGAGEDRCGVSDRASSFAQPCSRRRRPKWHARGKAS